MNCQKNRQSYVFYNPQRNGQVTCSTRVKLLVLARVYEKPKLCAFVDPYERRFTKGGFIMYSCCEEIEKIPLAS